jgi:hypothetical protein
MSPVLHLVTRQLRLSREMTSCLLADMRDRDNFCPYPRGQRRGIMMLDVSVSPFYFDKRGVAGA